MIINLVSGSGERWKPILNQIILNQIILNTMFYVNLWIVSKRPGIKRLASIAEAVVKPVSQRPT
jgi:hypothetical protein